MASIEKSKLKMGVYADLGRKLGDARAQNVHAALRHDGRMAGLALVLEHLDAMKPAIAEMTTPDQVHVAVVEAVQLLLKRTGREKDKITGVDVGLDKALMMIDEAFRAEDLKIQAEIRQQEEEESSAPKKRGNRRAPNA